MSDQEKNLRDEDLDKVSGGLSDPILRKVPPPIGGPHEVDSTSATEPKPPRVTPTA